MSDCRWKPLIHSRHSRKGQKVKAARRLQHFWYAAKKIKTQDEKEKGSARRLCRRHVAAHLLSQNVFTQSLWVPRLLPITHLPIGLLSSDFYPSHFYPSRLLPITGLSSKKDFYPSGHSPIRTFTHLFYFKHHKQRSIKRKLNPSLSLNKKLFFHRHLPEQCWVHAAKPCFPFR